MASSCCRGPGLCQPQGLTMYFPSARDPPTVTRGGRASLGKVSFPAPWVCSDTETFQTRVSPSPLSPGLFALGTTGVFQCLLPQLLTLGELWDFVQLLPARAVRKALSRSERRGEERRLFHCLHSWKVAVTRKSKKHYPTSPCASGCVWNWRSS